MTGFEILSIEFREGFDGQLYLESFRAWLAARLPLLRRL